MAHHCFVSCRQSLWSIRCKVAVGYITEFLNPPEFSYLQVHEKAKPKCTCGNWSTVGVLNALTRFERVDIFKTLHDINTTKKSSTYSILQLKLFYGERSYCIVQIEPATVHYSKNIRCTVQADVWEILSISVEVKCALKILFSSFLSQFRDDEDAIEPIDGFPKQHRYGLNRVLEFLTPLCAKGLQSVLLFGISAKLAKVSSGTVMVPFKSP